ncbi:MAG: glycosyltransferase [Gemmataceae bacterium]
MTPQHRYRVLYDLSPLTAGFSDPGQITWLNFRLLCQLPELEVTGLIAAPGGQLALHEFAPLDDVEQVRANQAAFLDQLGAAGPALDAGGLGQRLGWFYRLLFAPTCNAQPLDPAIDWPVRLRDLLDRTLSPADVEALRKGQFLLSTFNRLAMTVRLRGGLPAQKLDTRGFDFVIFQNPCVARVHEGSRKIVCLHELPVVPDSAPDGQVLRRQQAELRGAARDSFFVCRTPAARAELSRCYGVADQCSCVIPYPLNGFFSKDGHRDRVARVLAERRRTDLPGGDPATGSYFLAVGPLEPRCNLPALLQACYRLNAHRGERVQLVLVARGGWKSDALTPLLHTLAREGQLLVLDGVKPHELRLLYSHAVALVDVAYHEAGTLAPLEALQCGCPIVLSDLPGHRALAGPAALYCDPYDVEALVVALARSANATPRQREDRVDAGCRHLESFRNEFLRQRWLDVLNVADGLRCAA